MLLVKQDEIAVTDAAEVLGVHRVTVWHWCRRGYLKARRRGANYFPLLAAVLALKAKARKIARLKVA